MKRFGIKTVIAMLVAALLLFMVVPSASATEVWKQKIVRFSGVAGETLAIGDVVCIAPADGQVYKADANDSGLRPAIGVIGKGGAINATVEIVVMGILDGQTARSPGARLFLSETAGAFTATGPTNAQVVGWVMPGVTDTATSTKYFIKPEPPVSEGGGY